MASNELRPVHRIVPQQGIIWLQTSLGGEAEKPFLGGGEEVSRTSVPLRQTALASASGEPLPRLLSAFLAALFPLLCLVMCRVLGLGDFLGNHGASERVFHPQSLETFVGKTVLSVSPC